MNRVVVLALAVVALALAGCTEDDTPSLSIPAAEPQTVTLDWVETTSAEGPALVFGVRRLEVGAKGWKAEISLANKTSTPFEIPPEIDSSDRAFGLMLFTDGERSTLDEQTRQGTTPPVRVAWETTPSTPTTLEPGATWKGTISAPGRLQRGAFVRVSFGPFTPTGTPPDGIPNGQFTWITDHAYRLR